MLNNKASKGNCKVVTKTLFANFYRERSTVGEHRRLNARESLSTIENFEKKFISLLSILAK
jgi:hypothetical protein